MTSEKPPGLKRGHNLLLTGSSFSPPQTPPPFVAPPHWFLRQWRRSFVNRDDVLQRASSSPVCVCAYQPLPSALAVMIWIIKILNSNNNNNSELKITRNRTRVWCRRSFLWSLFHSFKAPVFNLVYKSCIQLSTGWYSQKFPCRFMD